MTLGTSGGEVGMSTKDTGRESVMWKQNLGEVARVEGVTFNIPGLGRGGSRC